MYSRMVCVVLHSHQFSRCRRTRGISAACRLHPLRLRYLRPLCVRGCFFGRGRMDEESVALPTARSSAPTSSGGKKLRARNALPQVFILVVTTIPSRCVGAFVAAGAYTLRDGSCIVVPSGCCLLKDAVPIQRKDHTRSDGLFRLVPQMESYVRSSLTCSGQSLNAQFSAFAAQLWRRWPFSCEDIKTLGDGSHPRFFRVEACRFKTMGWDLSSLTVWAKSCRG